ncbi:hypothetical protein L195_g021153 [Trifolium pratense]|uniref:Uncharacterized protein n=1 Tax=Trifolium pratense TaxID=57577 RepID=A0A2K3N4I1_TRIPR|nr:hypothetical protein L195_g021153 [Trifolium pratense]
MTAIKLLKANLLWSGGRRSIVMCMSRNILDTSKLAHIPLWHISDPDQTTYNSVGVQDDSIGYALLIIIILNPTDVLEVVVGDIDIAFGLVGEDCGVNQEKEVCSGCIAMIHMHVGLISVFFSSTCNSQVDGNDLLPICRLCMGAFYGCHFIVSISMT